MFAFKPRKEIATRILLSAAILVNAFASNPAPVQAKQEAIKTGQLENRSVQNFPTFARPDVRVAQRDEQHLDVSALMSNSTYAQSQQMQMYTANGEEGLRLAQDWFAQPSGLSVDWIVQKNSNISTATLWTFYSSSIASHESILSNFVGPIPDPYIVPSTETGPNGWVSFQLAGIPTAGTSGDGFMRANFYVDIVSPAGLPVTCDNYHTFGRNTAICIQDSVSHVHGMADGGGWPYPSYFPFNSGGGEARVAVKGLTAGQELIVTFYTPINDLNTLSTGECSIGCAATTNGFTLMPINTRTGNYEYYTEDISIPTSAGNLSFTRDYVSATTSLSTTLSPGWTHNLDTHLTLPTDPNAYSGKVIFKAHTANQYLFTFNKVANVYTYTPEPGLQAALVRNSGTPITYTLNDSGQKTYTFNATGKLLTYADAQGHIWTYSYLPDGKLDQVTADGGKFLNLDYDGQGRVILVKDHTTRSVSYTYNANGDLDSFTDVLEQPWTYEYNDPNLVHFLTRVAAPGDVTVERQEYYSNGKAWKQYDGEDNLIVELIYNTDGTTTIKDALNNVETHTYNDRGVLVTETNGAGGNLGKYYDPNFRPGVITDPSGNPTNLTWGDNGTNLTNITDALQNQTNITYGAYNNPTSILDPLQYETKYFYADTNYPTLPTRVEYPLSFDGGVTYIGTDYEYYPPASGASAGKVKFVTDALGNKTQYTYTSAGQTATVTSAYGTPNAQTVTYGYDTLGRLVDTTDTQGIVTHNEYDAAGQLLKTTHNYVPARPQNDENKYNLVTEYRYDIRGNQIAVIDTYGTITRTYYDLDNRPVTVVQNLTGQSIETATPPAQGANATENIRTDTVYDDAGNVIATIDPAGVITRVYYDNANRPVTTVQNLTGQAISVATPPSYTSTNPDQNIHTDTTYDANGNVIASTDTLGVITRTYYDVLNRPVTTVQNLTGQAVSVATPPARGSSSNIRTDTVYDANGNVIATEDPKGIITRTYYDALNRPMTVVQNLIGQAISNSTPPAAGSSDTNIRTDTYYDQAGNGIATVDPRGAVTRTYYDSANRPYATVQNLVGQDIYITTPPLRGSGGPDENIRTDIAYDSFGRRDFTADPLGRVTKYEYNDAGQLSRVIGNFVNGGAPQNDQNQRNIVTAYEYDALGRQVKVTDTSGRVTKSDYDDLSRILTTTQNYLQGQPQNYKDALADQYNLITMFTYDVRGSQIAVTDTKGIVTRTYYDLLGRSVTVVRNFTGNINDPSAPARGNPIDPLANLRTNTVYLGNGSVDYVLDEPGEKTDYAYDELGRLTAVSDTLLHATNFVYDANSNRTLMTDAEGTATSYEYDNLNRLKAVVENYKSGINPNVETNVRTEYTYDAGGNRLSIRDGNSFLDNVDYRTIFTYDDLGRLKTEKDALNHTTTYDYLADYILKINRVVLTDANGQPTTSYYDELDRPKQIDYPSPDADVTFAYDALGRRLSMTDGLGTTSWTYTNIDQPNLITDPFGTGISYDYDALGNRTALSYGSQSYSYQYDDLNRLETVVSGQSSVAGYQYDAAGRLKTVSRPNSVNTTYNYFDNGWLQDITHSSGAATLASYQYQYYDNGNRKQAIEDIQNPQQFASMNSGTLLAANTQNIAQPVDPMGVDFNVNYKPASLESLHTIAPQQIDFNRLPLSFAANIGQFDKDVKFQTNSLGGSIFFTPSEVVLALMDKKETKFKDDESASSSASENTKVVRVEYLNAEKNPVVEGLELLPGVANFMVGSDKKAWLANAPTYAGVIYRTLYPGVDLRYEGAEGSLKSTFTVAPGADSALIQWQYKDAGNVSLDADGNLRIKLPAKKAGETETILVEHAPVAWQERDGQRVDVAVQYVITQKGEISFVFPQGYDVSLPLTIDPVLTYGTYLGGNGSDRGKAITTDSDGNAYVTGYSSCGSSFPLVNPIQQGGAGAHDVIISKISADGHTLLFSTCIGGAGDETGFGIGVDAQGQIAVAGETKSTDFPIVGGIATYGGDAGLCTVDAPCQDNFLLSLNAAGTAIRFSTYLGGDGREEFGGLAIDSTGKIVVVGSTTSTNFPAVNAYDNSYATGGTCSSTSPCWDATFTRIDPSLTGTNAILYSTYLGGITRDKAFGVTLDDSGKAYIIGSSDSDSYPTRNALQAIRNGSYDVVITEIDPSLSGDASFLYATYLGTSSSDSGYAIARDSSGSLYLTGRTSSARFPLRDPLQYQSHASTNCAGSSCYEAFVTKLNIATNTIVYSTYLGGSADEEAYGIAVDSYGRAYVTGFTESTDFPTASPLQSTKGTDGCGAPPCADAFLSVIEPNGQTFAYSTYLGGSGEDIASGLTLDTVGNVYVVGQTYSTDFVTTPNAYDLSNTNNNADAFIVKIAALSAPASVNPSVTIPVSASSDDAEQSASGSVSLASTDLELIRESSDQKVGIRFAGVNLPQGAIILNAEIQFTVDEVTSETTTLTIQAQASDNAPTFVSTSNNISSRAKTSASVIWTPAAWNTVHESGPDQRTPELAAVIQEVINRPGWAPGNALAIIITGTGKRVAKSYEEDIYGAPYLHIEYTLLTPPTPTYTPTATATETPTSTPTATATASQTATATSTSTPTSTPTFTPTGTATFTPTPTVTPIPSGPITITYIYDPLNRLTEANYYETGDYYHYTYDAVGNRLTQEKTILGVLTTDTYLYDDANRIESVNSAPYTFDANGNLLDDGVNTYVYDSANRLKTMNSGQPSESSYQYNGLGDRIQQTMNGQTTTYTLDLNAGLTQVLSDGTNTYLYGLGRIAQAAGTDTEYFLGDALGSVRQLTAGNGDITLTKSYAPYGEVLSSAGSSSSPFAFTGEQQDASGLTYLRARYYASDTGRFLTRDTWEGSVKRPITFNQWVYVDANPINKYDPSGLCSQAGWNDPVGGLFSREQCNKLENIYLDVTSGRNYDGLQEMQDWYYKLTDRMENDGNLQAATNMRHYLEGTGSQLQLSNTFMENYIWGWDYVNNKVSDLADWYIKTQISSCEPSIPVAVGPDIFATGIDVSLNNLAMWGNWNWPNPDAYGSLGSFRLDVTVSGSVIQPWLVASNAFTQADLNLHLTVLDFYNWHAGQQVIYPGPLSGAEIPDDWAYLLTFNPSGRGYGRAFLIRGDINIPYKKNLWFATAQDINYPPAGWFKASCIGIGFSNGNYTGCAP